MSATEAATILRPIIALDGGSKAYGAVQALDRVSIELRPRQVRALVGENGAGKSTLVRLLAGVERPDSGRVLLDSEDAEFHNPTDARDAGIAVIYQEATLFPDLSVAENVFMGRHPLGAGARIDRAALERQVRELFERLGVHLDPEDPVRGLSIADQQIVEIAKALSFDARVLIMDEPTAALSRPEVERLFRVVRTLRERDVAVLFISHRLEEVFEISSAVTVMRDGEVVHDGPTVDLSRDELVGKMVGRELTAMFPKGDSEIGRELLTVSRLTREGLFVDVSFSVRAGEIVALSGLVGAGRTEVARAIFGIDRPDAGKVSVDGVELRPASPTAAMAAGVGLVPEDRRHQGLVMDLSLERNLTLTHVGALSRLGVIGRGTERRVAGDWAERLRIRFHRLNEPVNYLSGGNQQKVVLAKWLATDPKVLIIDEPTRGIDVGTKAEVHRLLSELAGRGIAVLMISSELTEVLGMADRILVMHEGRISRELPGGETTEESVMQAATGRVSEEALGA